MAARTVGSKRRVIQKRMSIRYGQILDRPTWSEEGTREPGYTLRTDVEAGQSRRSEIEKRLAWPRAPRHDVLV